MKSLAELLEEKNIKKLRTYQIAENELLQCSNVVGYAFENDSWIVYIVDERRQKAVLKTFDSEEEAILEAYRIIKAFHYVGR